VIGRLPEAVMWHYVRDDETEPRVGYRGIDPRRLAAQLDRICRVATPVGWSDLLAALTGDRALPGDAVILTFDDGLMDHHRTVLPALVERGLLAIFFVLARVPGDRLTLGHRLHVLTGSYTPTDVRAWVMDAMTPSERARYRALESAMAAAEPDDADDVWKRPLQRELADVAGPILTSMVERLIGPEAEIATALHLGPREIEDMAAAGMTIGGHGRAHAWMDVPGSAAASEVAASAAYLGPRLPGPWPSAYPYGGVPTRPGPLLESAGFVAAFSTAAGRRQDRYRIGRRDGDSTAAIDDWLMGAAP